MQKPEHMDAESATYHLAAELKGHEADVSFSVNE